MENRTLWLLAGLAGAGVLWAWSRTQSGSSAIAAAASATGSAVTGAGAWIMSTIRGIRNNNPGNIKHSADVWEGQAPQQTDATFVQFTAPEWGIRAMTRIMRVHYDAGATTLRQLITIWAPPSENDTASYIAAVSSCSGLDPDTTYDFDTMVAQLVPCVITQENGLQPYPTDLIAQGISLESTA
jgi:hypothetical protein